MLGASPTIGKRGFQSIVFPPGRGIDQIVVHLHEQQRELIRLPLVVMRWAMLSSNLWSPFRLPSTFGRTLAQWGKPPSPSRQAALKARQEKNWRTNFPPQFALWGGTRGPCGSVVASEGWCWPCRIESGRAAGELPCTPIWIPKVEEMSLRNALLVKGRDTSKICQLGIWCILPRGAKVTAEAAAAGWILARCMSRLGTPLDPPPPSPPHPTQPTNRQPLCPPSTTDPCTCTFLCSPATGAEFRLLGL